MRKTKSAILDAVHHTAKGLNKAGAMDAATLRAFGRLCRPVGKTPAAGGKRTPAER